MQPSATSRSRRIDLDAWRGLAILAMVGDHIAAFIQHLLNEGNLAETSLLWDSSLFFRFTIGRIALPVFMIVSGMLIEAQGVRLKRYMQVVAAALVVNLLWTFIPSGAAAPDILLLWAALIPFAFLWRKYPVLFAALSFIQLSNWQISWGGYQPGDVLLLLCIGVLAQKANMKFPSLRDFDQPMGWLGRHPLSLYVGHIVLISFTSFLVVR